MGLPPRGAESDEALMGRAQAGDADAFAALYDRHAERAFRVARAVCRDNGQAEDAVQEGFLAIWRARDTYDDRQDGRAGPGTFRAWSMRIVRNRAIDSSRKAATRPPPQSVADNVDRPQADANAASPSDEAIAAGQRDDLLDLLRQLPDAQAEVIVLAFYGELSHSEIARQLDLPPGTVKGRMRLGLEKLRGQMRANAPEGTRG